VDVCMYENTTCMLARKTSCQFQSRFCIFQNPVDSTTSLILLVLSFYNEQVLVPIFCTWLEQIETSFSGDLISEAITVICSGCIRDQCSIVVSIEHEKGQERGNLKYSVSRSRPNANDISKHYYIRKLSKNKYDGVVFTLKPEYRMNVTNHENATSGTWAQCQYHDFSMSKADNEVHSEVKWNLVSCNFPK
jgi:hypothetical protein